MSPAELVLTAMQRPAFVRYKKGDVWDTVGGVVQWDLSTRDFMVVRVGNGTGSHDMWIARRFIATVTFAGIDADAHRLRREASE